MTRPMSDGRYCAPRTVTFAWTSIASAGLALLLQVVPLTYLIVTAPEWTADLVDDRGNALTPDAVFVNQIFAVALVFLLALIVLVVAFGIRHGSSGARVVAPLLAVFVLVFCPQYDFNRVSQLGLVTDPPLSILLLAVIGFAMYPLLVAGSVLVLLRPSRPHFLPRYKP